MILWDRLFGTFEEEDDNEPVVFGVRKPLANWNPFWANFQVYDYLLFDARRTRRWRDKLGIWFRRTGWRPTDVADAYPKKPSDLTAFRKYDPDIGVGMRRYVLFQFAVAIFETLIILQIIVGAGARYAIIPCLVLWAHLYTLGLLNEGRSKAGQMELMRLLVFNWLAAWLLQFAGIEVAAGGWILAAVYTAASTATIWALNKPSENILKQQGK